MEPREYLFDLSTRENRKKATEQISDILSEIYMIEYEIYELLLACDELSSDDWSLEKYIADELIDIFPTLANLYD